ncbi:MAG TPA: Trp biosynthesis-associated membrane protein [Pseudonocardia sp.]|nr:Trp biosynthesis-associated membrane protein [Pseudonocardia sp.]
MTGRRSAGRRSAGRALGLTAAGLVAAAALLWWGSAAVWFAVHPPGRPVVELTGVQVSAAPGSTALLALAGVAGVIATAGPLRRGIGLLLGAAGVVVAVLMVRTVLGGVPAEARPAAAPGAVPAGAAPAVLPVEVGAASWLAVAGAVVLGAVGAFVALREPRLARLGARYDRDDARRVELDPDRAAWQQLDAGRDPTADPAFDAAVDQGEDPCDDKRSRAG